ncbi:MULTISPECIES: hypothetical protein [Salinibaculum]|uniref:hypothetical protein n=1 Tax=Salinibaculum TaxID=2732368 RepID=UPI0030D3FCD7
MKNGHDPWKILPGIAGATRCALDCNPRRSGRAEPATVVCDCITYFVATMERGTQWERDAVRDRWEEFERQHRAVNRLLVGCIGFLGGAVVLFLAWSSGVCSFTPGGAPVQCRPVSGHVTTLALTAVGLGMSAVGGLVTWRALRP